MVRTLYAVSSLLTGIGILLMGLALLGTSLGVRAVSEGFNDTVTGLIMASYFGGFILGTYLCPGIVRRIGPIRTYAALAAIASVCAFAHALIIDPVIWSLLRFIIGVCLVGLYMVLESWLNTIAPNEKRGQIFALYMTVTLAAHAVGQFLLLFDPGAQLIAFGLAAACFSLGLVPVALTRLPEPPPVGVPSLHFIQLMRISPLSVAGALVGGLVTSSFWALGAVFAQRIGLSGLDIVLFMSITIAGGVVLQWPIGHLSDFIDRRWILLLVASLAAVAALLTAVLHHISPLLLYGCAFVFGALIFPIYSLSVAYLNDRISHENMLEASRGILLVYGIGALFGPILAGLSMNQFGPSWLFVYNALVLALFVLFTWIRMRHSLPVPEADRSSFVPMTRTSQVVLEMDPRLDGEQGHEQTEQPAKL